MSGAEFSYETITYRPEAPGTGFVFKIALKLALGQEKDPLKLPSNRGEVQCTGTNLQSGCCATEP